MLLKKFAFAAILAMALSQSASAADLVIYLNQATESGVRELAAAFAQATGNKVEVSFQAGAALNEKINAGELGDLTTLGLRAIRALHQKRKDCARQRRRICAGG